MQMPQSNHLVTRTQERLVSRQTSGGRLASTLVIACVLLAGPFVRATTLAPGGTVVPSAADASGPILADTGNLPFMIGASSGTVRELVVADTLNSFGVGDLSFLVQVSVTVGSVNQILLGNFGALPLDVSQAMGHPPFIAGSASASTADRMTAGFVAYDFATPIAGGSASMDLITRTGVTTFGPGSIEVGNANGVETLSGFAPVPEYASTLLLLATGITCLLGWDLCRQKRALADR